MGDCRKWVGLALVALLTGPALAETMMFQEQVSPTDSYTHQGTRIRQAAPDSNENGNQKFWIAGTLGADGPLRTIVSYDLSALPANVEVTSVRLVLNQIADPSSSSDPFTAELRPLLKGFVEGQATWNQAAAGDPWTTPGGDFGPTVLSSRQGTPQGDVVFTFPSTPEFVSAVQDALADDDIVRFIIKGDAAMEASSSRNFFFFSGDEDAAGSADAPALVVDYVPEPASLLVLAGGGLLVVGRRRSS